MTRKTRKSTRRKHSPPDPSAPTTTLDVVLAAEPGLACLVFSFLPNVRDRCNLASVGRVFRDADAQVASLPAAFDFAGYGSRQRGYNGNPLRYLMRHDGVLDLPQARVEELLASVTPRLPGKIYERFVQRGVQPTSEKAKSFCGMAAYVGDLELLEWLREHEYPWGGEHGCDTCAHAATKGHLDVLQWARANGASWDTQVCGNAAFHGHLHILRWARANGAPWDSFTAFSCALGGQMESLVWAIDHGAPVDWDAYGAAIRQGRNDIADFLFDILAADGTPM